MIKLELGAETEAYVAELVRAGRYPTPDAVLQEAVRLVRYKEAQLADVDAAVEQGLADGDAGRSETIDEVRSRLTAKYRRMAA